MAHESAGSNHKHFSTIERALGRIEGKLDGILAEQSRLRGEQGALHRRVSSVDDQVQNVRNRQSRVLGYAAALGAAAGAVLGLVGILFRWWLG